MINGPAEPCSRWRETKQVVVLGSSPAQEPPLGSPRTGSRLGRILRMAMQITAPQTPQTSKSRRDETRRDEVDAAQSGLTR